MSDIKFEREFLQGQRDCRDGRPHTGGSDAYYRGYATQYESDQISTEQSLRAENSRGH